MTLVLALDTSTEHVALALGRFEPDGVRVLGSRDFAAPRAALSQLVPAIGVLLSETGTERVSIGTVVVGRGPGSFTGVRIGVSSAKGIAEGLGARLLGVGTLDAVAWRFAAEDRLVGVVGDAMRGEVYPALFRCGDGRCERLTSDRVMKPAEAAGRWRELLDGQAEAVGRGFGPLPERGLLLAGNGLAKYGALFRDTLPEAEIVPSDQWPPTGENLLRAAYACAEGGGDSATVLPVYTRLSDAEEAERARRREADAVDAPAGAVPDSGVAGPSGGEER